MFRSNQAGVEYAINGAGLKEFGDIFVINKPITTMAPENQ
tara:strand:+ start:1126 stop:1245 length:120 start_codon:yes stop_codon:yes gene_type:complete